MGFVADVRTAIDAKPQVNRNTPRKTNWAALLLGGLIGGALASWFLQYDDGRTSVLALPFAWFVSTFLHEGGHAVGALAGRFRLLVFAVWPVKFYRRKDSWTAEWWRGAFRSGLAGFVAAYPKDSANLVPRLAWLVACGPLASFALAVVSWTLARYFDDGIRWLPPQLNILAVIAMLQGLLSIWPVSNQRAATDGARLLALRRGGEAAERFASLLVLLGCSSAGQRPRDWDPEMVGRAAGRMDESADSVVGHAMRYNWLLDSKQFEQAGTALDWLSSRMPTPDSQKVWQLEKIWFDARLRQIAPPADAFPHPASAQRRIPMIQCAYFKARAASELLEHRWKDAEMSAREVLLATEKLADRGIAAAIRDEAESILQEAAVAAG